jgi:hypothetical protein
VNLVDQASNLVARTTNFPEGASNNQLCRYLYYVGRIQAVQLDYSDAYTKLNQVCIVCGTKSLVHILQLDYTDAYTKLNQVRIVCGTKSGRQVVCGQENHR